MDNVTHSLIGFALGKTFGRRVGHERTAIAAGLIASNLPDLDFVIPPLLQILGDDPKLSYLLHHRGHTHTLILLPLLALITAWLAPRWARAREPVAFGRLFLLALLAGVLHIGADAWNNYGVHPFWPWSGQWYYGDFIFIVEPWIAFALFPLAVQGVSSRWARAIWLSLAALLMGVVWLGPFTSTMTAAAITAWAAILAFAQWRLRGLGVAWLGLAVTLASFASAGRVVEAAFQKHIARERPDERILDVSSTPSPGNPFCWRAVVTSVSPEGTYHARLGGLTLEPEGSRSDAVSCGFDFLGSRTAPIEEPTLSSTAQIRWAGEFRGPLSDLRAWRDQDCRVAAALRFIRTPFWVRDGDDLILGDLRYDREPELGFAELRLPSPGASTVACPHAVPGWTPPLMAP